MANASQWTAEFQAEVGKMLASLDRARSLRAAIQHASSIHYKKKGEDPDDGFATKSKKWLEDRGPFGGGGYLESNDIIAAMFVFDKLNAVLVDNDLEQFHHVTQ